MLPKFEFKGDFIFQTKIDVRLLDLNAGAHLSNDKILNYLTEVNERFLRVNGASLTDIGHCTLVVSASYIRFKKEVFYPETLTLKLGIMKITKMRVFFYYEVTNIEGVLTHQAIIESALVDNQTGKIQTTDKLSLLIQD